MGLGGEKDGMEITNMEIIFPGRDTNIKETHAAVSTSPRPNLKTWKRMARRGVQDMEASMPEKKTKRVWNDSLDSTGEGPKKIRKRRKQAGGIPGVEEELLAEAVK
jgi:hypothetical protein